MKIDINAYSLQEAFNLLEETVVDEIEESKHPKSFKKFINLDEIAGSFEVADSFYEGLEYTGLLCGYCIYSPGENTNKSIKSVVSNHSVSGDKKWETTYAVVLDNSKSTESLEGTFKIKKEAIDAGRKFTEETGRSTYVIIGKKPSGFDRLQSEITYKSSQGQKLGCYRFVW
jgi:hypothetical protein